MYYAHSANQDGKWHPLIQHLDRAAIMAERFALTQSVKSEARLAGILHDLGKYGDAFQARLQGRGGRIDHWSAGAWVALSEYRAVAAALAIQGHHIGLQHLDKSSLQALEPQRLEEGHPLGLRLSEGNIENLMRRFKQDGGLPTVTRRTVLGNDLTSTAGRMLDVRMVYSCLVDADFLDTEAHFESDSQVGGFRAPGPPLRPDQALALVEEYVRSLEALKAGRIPRRVTEIRRKVYSACLASAESEPGLFTLSAPTGSGKTLAMLAFALKHAARWKLGRVIVVIPYLSIIQQTVEVYRVIFEQQFGTEYVLEHHSLARGAGDDFSDAVALDDELNSEVSPLRRLQLLSENWDAPLIITTSVQLLESLFSDRPSACRKLHQLMRSVILFDEVQTLPANLAVPMLAALSHLAHEYNSTVVFSTATQPAFDHLHEPVKMHCAQGWQPRPIISALRPLFKAAKKTTVTWDEREARLTWEDLVARLKEVPQVLCIVNIKRHAREVLEALGDADALHLSTNLCPAHRRNVLAAVRERLRRGETTRLIATQCVEAGVDLDFPVVWRACGPLDAIIQAAGRCNRDGRLAGPGEVHVFLPEDERYPAGYYQQAAQVTKHLIRSLGGRNFDIGDPDFVRSYYLSLYNLTRPEISQAATRLLASIQAGDFPAVAKQFRLIPHDSINVVVPYADAEEDFRFLESNASDGLNRQWIRRARPLAVNLFRPQRDDPLWANLRPVLPTRKGGGALTDWYIYLRSEHYDERLGLVPQSGGDLWMI